MDCQRLIQGEPRLRFRFRDGCCCWVEAELDPSDWIARLALGAAQTLGQARRKAADLVVIELGDLDRSLKALPSGEGAVARRRRLDLKHSCAGECCSDDKASGVTTLHRAAQSGQATAIRLLVQLGLDVETPAEDGATPLYTACLHCRHEATKALLELGSDPFRASDMGITPHDVACPLARRLLERWQRFSAAQKLAVAKFGWPQDLWAVELIGLG